MHRIAEQVEAALSLPMVHIADATAERLLADGRRRIGLLGTRFTIRERFYRERLAKPFGLEVLVPSPIDQDRVHDVIHGELCFGRIEDASWQEYLRIIDKLHAAGAEAVILGCAEIALLVEQKHTEVPLYDTTRLHALKAVDLALEHAYASNREPRAQYRPLLTNHLHKRHAMPKVILITGGSRGIGAATARLAAERGYAVCISYHSDGRSAEEVVQAIQNSGNDGLAFQADVAQEADVIHLFEQCERRFGSVDALVNNAGILEQQMPLEHMKLERLRRVFDVNVLGSFLCAREAVRRMSTLNGGHGGGIVNVSSMAAQLGSPGEYVDYAAAKGAIDTLTVGLAKEVANAGIRVNAVRPGIIQTDIHASGGEPDRVERVRHSVPMQRGGTPEEVAQAILWLLSEEASYVTGTLLDVSGGR